MPAATVQLMTDPEATRRFLWPYLRRAHPGLQSISGVKLHAFGTVAAGRGVVKITLRGKFRWDPLKPMELFANYDTAGDSRDIYQFLEYLEKHGFGNGAYGAPKALCYSKKYKLLVYESFPGRRVRDDLEQRGLFPAALNVIMRQSAVWLRKFHRLPPRIGQTKKLRLAPTFFSKLTKDHRQVVSAALPYINKELARRGQQSLVHGDPHLANCIRGPRGSFAFIDFSESQVGSPAADIGMYLVHLDVALQPFFSRRVIGRAQRIFLKKYYGSDADRLPVDVRRSLLAYELRTAALFLRFTSDHHRRPSPQVAWMIQHFVNIMSRGTDELRGDDPRLILAS